MKVRSPAFPFSLIILLSALVVATELTKTSASSSSISLDTESSIGVDSDEFAGFQDDAQQGTVTPSLQVPPPLESHLPRLSSNFAQQVHQWIQQSQRLDELYQDPPRWEEFMLLSIALALETWGYSRTIHSNSWRKGWFATKYDIIVAPERLERGAIIELATPNLAKPKRRYSVDHYCNRLQRGFENARNANTKGQLYARWSIGVGKPATIFARSPYDGARMRDPDSSSTLLTDLRGRGLCRNFEHEMVRSAGDQAYVLSWRSIQ